MSDKKFFTVYRTTNKTTGDIYIGSHSTSNPNDSYFGSGKLLTLAISKYTEERILQKKLFRFARKARSTLFKMISLQKTIGLRKQ